MTAGSQRKSVSGSEAVVRRLTEVRARLAPDLTLQQFLKAVDGWDATIPLTMGLLVQGQMFRGILTGRVDFSKYLDQRLAGELESAAKVAVSESGGEEFSAAIRKVKEAFAGRFESISRKRGGREAELFRKLADYTKATQDPDGPVIALDVLEVPEDLLHEYVQFRAPRTGLSLSHAEIFMPGEGWLQVGTLRVNTREIGAWWLIDDQADGDQADGDDEADGDDQADGDAAGS